MGLKVVRADLTKMKVDAIVNSANQYVRVGNGIDRAVYTAAGEEKLLAARKVIGEIKPGEVAITSAYNLPSRYIIHAVIPIWSDGNSGEYEKIKLCYRKSLELAAKRGCKSIAVPLLGTGVFNYPREGVYQIAVSEIISFLLNAEMMVYLTVFDKASIELARRIWNDIEEFIDDNDALNLSQNEYVEKNDYLDHLLKPLYMMELGEISPEIEEYYNTIKTEITYALYNDTEDSFSQRVLHYMDAVYTKDQDFYKNAGIDRKTFYRIRDGKTISPKKDTVWGICLALKLDLFKTEQLMKLAKHTISKSDKRDKLLLECINNEMFNIHDVNIRLDEAELPILSSK